MAMFLTNRQWKNTDDRYFWCYSFHYCYSKKSIAFLSDDDLP